MAPLIKVITFALLATIAHTTSEKTAPPETTGPAATPSKKTDDPSLFSPTKVPTQIPTENPTVHYNDHLRCEGRAVAAFADSMSHLVHYYNGKK